MAVNLTIPYTITILAPPNSGITVVPANLDFGTVPQGTVASVSFTLSNAGAPVPVLITVPNMLTLSPMLSLLPSGDTTFIATADTSTSGAFTGSIIVTEDVAPPDGSVSIALGDDWQAAVDANPEGTVFSIATGVHRRQNVAPKQDQRFVGHVGAIMDGGANPTSLTGGVPYAFRSNASGVHIENLEIRHYSSPMQEAVIMHDGSGWVIDGNDVHNNLHVGIMSGDQHQMLNNHVHHNGQMGVKVVTGANALVQGNEVNNNGFMGNDGGVDELGGSKFVRHDSLIVRGNHFHHNQGHVAVWWDIDNFGNSICEQNLVEDNDRIGIDYEISYGNIVIRNNQVLRNGLENWVGAGSKWLFGSNILVQNSSGVEIHDNTIEVVRGNGSEPAIGIGIIDQNRGSGNQGPYRSQDINIHDNSFIITAGRDYAIGFPDGEEVAGKNIFIDGVQQTAGR